MTSEQNQQIIVEHIVNIDTTAENIAAIDSVATVVVQLVAVAGMLPDIAATAAMRSTLMSVAKKLSAVQSVADAVPLLEAVRNMEGYIRAALAARIEIASVVAHLDAVRSLAAQLDLLIQTPQHAADAQNAAKTAVEAAAQIDSQLNKAETARLGAELAENEAKTASQISVTASDAAAVSADKARQAADAAAAVSGVPDASRAAPGDPLIWNGTAFAMGTLAESLASLDGALGISEPVLQAIETAQTTADGLDAKVTQANAAATEAKTLAEGVDAKATQAQNDAASAKTTAESAGNAVNSFGTRLTAAETETVRLGESQNTHISNGDIHHPTLALVERINNAVSTGLATLRDNGTGTLPADRDSLKKLSDLLDVIQNALEGFLLGEGDGNRLAMLNAINTNRDAIAALQNDLVLRTEIVDNLESTDPISPLSANQGSVLSGLVSQAQRVADGAAKPWVKTVSALPESWPDDMQWNGLLLHSAVTEGNVTNPEWYINQRGTPVRLLTDATGIRLLDGTTVQTGVASALAASEGAQAAASSAQSAAEQAQSDAASAKTDAAIAKTTAEGVDAKATQAQSDAASAKTTAESAKTTADEALAKTPTLATQTTPGVVKGSGTVTIDGEGGLHASGAFVGQWVFLRQYPWPGYVGLGGELFENAIIRFPDLIAYLKTRPQECITEADWQARSAAASGKGGVPFYVYDEVANTLRVPDTRQDSWFHGGSGIWENDAIRNINGYFSPGKAGSHYTGVYLASGAFSIGPAGLATFFDGAPTNITSPYSVEFNASAVVPTGTTNHPSRIGMTMCVYAGTILGEL